MNLRACALIAILAGCGGSVVASDNDSGLQGSGGATSSPVGSAGSSNESSGSMNAGGSGENAGDQSSAMGGFGTGSGGAPAQVDAALPSTGMINKCGDGVMPGGGITCDHYCATFMSTCSAMFPSVYQDLASCLGKCQSFTQSQICCRGYHADLAATTPSPNAIPVHCPHAAGRQVCD
jgi:hypothetical protein